jgi:hypothetical protein
MNVQVKHSQTLTDIALMYGGGLEKTFQIAELNHYPLESILDNHVIEVPDFANSAEKELSKFLQVQATCYTAYPEP